MALWSFVQCSWCGFTGCGSPIDDRCPRCLRSPEPPPVKPKPSAPAES